MSGESDPNGKSLHEPGAKADAGKVQAGVLGDFALALLAVAEVGTHGAVKYTRGGWEHVQNGAERYTDAMWRHILAAKHQSSDTDSGLSHKAHAAWNALAVLELELRAEKFPATDTARIAEGCKAGVMASERERR